MERIYFESSSYDEFIEQLCQNFKEIIDKSKLDNNSEPEQLLTRQETANFLQISLPTLHSWTKAKVLKKIDPTKIKGGTGIIVVDILAQ